MTTTTELHAAIAQMQVLMREAADVIEHNAKSLAESHTKNGIIEDREVQAAVESDIDLVAHLRAAALPWDRRHKKPEPTGSMGMPVSCSKPLCAPGDHHPLCKLAELKAQPQHEPIYQFKKADGSWIDQAKHSYDYNVKHGHATVRVVYPSPRPPQQIKPEHLLALLQTANQELEKVIKVFDMAAPVHEPVRCPQVIIDAITMYGDARADQDANNAPTTSHERLADCIRLVRKALAAPVQQEPYFMFRECEDSQAKQPAVQQEPTKAMIDAAERIDWSDSDVRGNIVNMWQAMLALAEQQITEAQVEAALKAAHMHSTPESRKDMRRAIEAAAPQPAQRTDDTKRLDALAENSWDLRCFDMPTGADDADIGWRVVEHHMAKPNERTVAEVFRDDPRQAIDAAIAAANDIKRDA